MIKVMNDALKVGPVKFTRSRVKRYVTLAGISTDITYGWPTTRVGFVGAEWGRYGPAITSALFTKGTAQEVVFITHEDQVVCTSTCWTRVHAAPTLAALLRSIAIDYAASIPL